MQVVEEVQLYWEVILVMVVQAVVAMVAQIGQGVDNLLQQVLQIVVAVEGEVLVMVVGQTLLPKQVVQVLLLLDM